MTNTIQQIRNNILNDAKIQTEIGYGKLNDTEAYAGIKAFLYNKTLDDKLAAIFDKSNFRGRSEMALSHLIGSTSKRIPTYTELADNSEYTRALAKEGIALQIIHELINMGYYAAESRDTVAASYAKQRGEDTSTRFEETVYVMFEGTLDAKDETKGIHKIPGQLNTTYVKCNIGEQKLQRLTAEQKQYHRDLASRPLRIVKTTEEELTKYFHQTKWYKKIVSNKKTHGVEDQAMARRRIKLYIKTILELQEEERLYLSTWFDYRGRVYYDLNMLGLNPHGDSWEKHSWELADAKLINEDGYKSLVWAAVILGHSKLNQERAIAHFEAHRAEVFANLNSEVDMGKLRYNKRLIQAIEDYETKTPSHFLLAYDCTNGGLQHFSTAFHAEKAMKACNMGGLKTVMDSHATVGEAFGLEKHRDIAKKINTPLLHGSSFDTVTDALNAALKEAKINKEFTKGDVVNGIVDKYGKEAQYINVINTRARNIIVFSENNQTTHSFTTRDGFRARSISYIENEKHTVKVFSTENSTGITQATVATTLPYSRGGAAAAKSENEKADDKISGFYANVTHSIDATTLRAVDATMYVHDNFLTHPNDMSSVIDQFRDEMVKTFDENPYIKAMEECGVPTANLKQGTGTKAMLMKSNNFMIA